MTKRVLFVCLGNICRSPMAEAVLRKLAAEENLNIDVDSAGLGRWHVGDPPDRRAYNSAKARGYDLTGQVGRRVALEDFEEFDVILAMDRSNLNKLNNMRPEGARVEVSLMMTFASELDDVEVPDPYYSNKFDQSLDVIEFGVRALCAKLKEQSA